MTPPLPLSETYSSTLVLVSIAIAVITSFTAFGTSERSASATQRSYKIAWNLFGATSMGLGIWAMHFIGMLALILPIPVTYDLKITIISIIPAIFACSIILWMMAKKSYGHGRLLLNGLLLGAGIGLMHHIGMAAMRMDAVMEYSKPLSIISVIFAITAATIALEIKSRTANLGSSPLLNRRKAVSASIMGLAISGMHYTAMAAVDFLPASAVNTPQGMSPEGLAIMVSSVTLIIIAASILAPYILKYRQTTKELSQLIQKEKKSAARIQAIIDSSQDALIQMNSLGEISGWSHQAEQVFGWLESDVLGKPITELINYKTVQSDNLADALTKKSSSLFGELIEASAQHREGHTFPIELTVGVIETGSQHTFSAFIRDTSSRKRDEKVLRTLAEKSFTGKESGFKEIVRLLATSYGMRYAMISLIDTNDPSQANTLAVWAGDGFADNISYPLLGSPCEKVTQEGLCFYPENIQSLFPEDHLLADMEAESYLGLPLRNSQGVAIGIINILDDEPITNSSKTTLLLESLATRIAIEIERQESEKKLKLLARVFSETHNGIGITDANGLLVDINPAFSKITGYSKKEAIGQNPRILKSGEQNPKPHTGLKQALDKQGYWQGEMWNHKKGGELYAEHLTISALKDDAGQTLNYLGIFSDTTHSKEQQKALELMAHYDVLTNLPNRVLFYDRFLQAVAHSKRTKKLLAICFLDLDNFKPVNDTFGHNVGDQLLIEVAGRIRRNIREEDTVSRQGGDEFTLLLGDLDSFSPCEQMLKRMLSALAEPYQIDGQTIDVSASLGVTLYPQDDEDIDTLTRHADQAMYQAKLAGKNRYHLYNPEFDQQVSQKHQRLSEIQKALLNDEFRLFYQPKVNMKTGEVYGVEALIRWFHPEKGLIPPLDFLPVIAETLLETQIGEWVIQQALEQIAHWEKQGISLEVSVNIASYHLQSTTFVGQLEKALLKQPTANPNRLQLEILESSALGDTQVINSIITTCQEALGVKVALDDFGTGYSSLTHLRNLPAETIKIDQSFVRDMLDDPDDCAIIDGIIGLADSFDREVIAEGVETTEHGLMLLLMGCEYAQGYSIARPMPVEEFTAWLNNHTPNEAWIKYAQSESNPKEKRAQQLNLAIKRWEKLFEEAIQSDPDQLQNWPAMGQTKCTFGSWIKREKNEQLFDTEWLEELDQIHNRVHSTAESLKILYQERALETARDKLPLVKSEFSKMQALLAAAN